MSRPAPNVEQQRSTDSAVLRQQVQSAAFLEDLYAALQDVVAQVGHDLDSRQIALVHRAVKRLTCKRLLMNRAVRVAIEDAPDRVFQLQDPLRCFLNQPPRQFLVVEIGPSLDRVAEMSLQGISGIEHRIVAALYHAGAPALAKQSLDRDDDLQCGRAFTRVQRREHAGAARSDDQQVGIQRVDG